MLLIQTCYKYPILIDAATAAMVRKGNVFLARWADIMTGRVPKFHLLHPDCLIVVTFELVVLLIKRFFGGGWGKKGAVAEGVLQDDKTKLGRLADLLGSTCSV